MAKKILDYIKLQIPAGKANPSPPVGPALGQRGVNIMDFCKAFNSATQQAGDVVIAADRLLVGRLERVGPLRLLVRPVAHPDSGPVEVAVVRTAHNPDRPLDRLLLQPDGTGVLHADIDRRVDIQVGDRLMLTDPSWPNRVQGLVLAIVRSLEPIDDAPLRQRVVAVPAAPPQSVVQVAVVSAQREASAP